MPRRAVLIGAGVVVALIAVVAILFALDDGDGFTLVVADPPSRAYLSIFLLIAGDAVIPIFPGRFRADSVGGAGKGSGSYGIRIAEVVARTTIRGCAAAVVARVSTA